MLHRNSYDKYIKYFKLSIIIESLFYLLTFGTEVFDWYFLITTDDFSRQSQDLKGSDYRFVQAVLSVEDFSIGIDITVYNTTLKFNKQGDYNINVYDVLGKQNSNETIAFSVSTIHELGLQTSGLYIIKITSSLNAKTMKIIKS